MPTVDEARGADEDMPTVDEARGANAKGKGTMDVIEGEDDAKHFRTAKASKKGGGNAKKVWCTGDGKEEKEGEDDAMQNRTTKASKKVGGNSKKGESTGDGKKEKGGEDDAKQQRTTKVTRQAGGTVKKGGGTGDAKGKDDAKEGSTRQAAKDGGVDAKGEAETDETETAEGGKAARDTASVVDEYAGEESDSATLSELFILNGPKRPAGRGLKPRACKA